MPGDASRTFWEPDPTGPVSIHGFKKYEVQSFVDAHDNLIIDWTATASRPREC